MASMHDVVAKWRHVHVAQASATAKWELVVWSAALKFCTSTASQMLQLGGRRKQTTCKTTTRIAFGGQKSVMLFGVDVLEGG